MALSDLKAGYAPRPFDPIRGSNWDTPAQNSLQDADDLDSATVPVFSLHEVQMQMACARSRPRRGNGRAGIP